MSTSKILFLSWWVDKGQRWIGCGGRWRRLNTEEQGKGRVEVKGKGRWKGTRSSFSWTNWWTSPPAPTAFSSATILGLDAKMGAPSCPWSMRWDALQPWVQGVARGRGPYLHTRGSVRDNEHRPAYVLHSGGGRQEGDATQGDARDTLWASLPCQVCHKCNSSMQQLSYNGAYPHLQTSASLCYSNRWLTTAQRIVYMWTRKHGLSGNNLRVLESLAKFCLQSWQVWGSWGPNQRRWEMSSHSTWEQEHGTRIQSAWYSPCWPAPSSLRGSLPSARCWCWRVGGSLVITLSGPGSPQS